MLPCLLLLGRVLGGALRIAPLIAGLGVTAAGRATAATGFNLDALAETGATTRAARTGGLTGLAVLRPAALRAIGFDLEADAAFPRDDATAARAGRAEATRGDPFLLASGFDLIFFVGVAVFFGRAD